MSERLNGPAHDLQDSPADSARLTGGAERRASLRIACGLPGSCELGEAAGGERWPGRILDVSLGGVGLLVPRDIHPGELLRVDVEEVAGVAVPPLWGRVVCVRSEAGGGWLLGCAHARAFSAAELRALLELQQILSDGVKGRGFTGAAERSLPPLLAVCAWCKRIRFSDNLWQPAGDHLLRPLDLRLTHGICPECTEQQLRGRLS